MQNKKFRFVEELNSIKTEKKLISQNKDVFLTTKKFISVQTFDEKKKSVKTNKNKFQFENKKICKQNDFFGVTHFFGSLLVFLFSSSPFPPPTYSSWKSPLRFIYILSILYTIYHFCTIPLCYLLYDQDITLTFQLGIVFTTTVC